MDKQFDELSKSLAKGVSRRDALRKFGLGLGGVLMACFAIGNGQQAVAQGDYTCCFYTCIGIGGFKSRKTHMKVWVPPGTACPTNGLCTLDKSQSVADCGNCK